MSISLRLLSLYLRLAKKPELARMTSEVDMRRGLQNAAARFRAPRPPLQTRLDRLPGGPPPPADLFTGVFADEGGAAPSLVRLRRADRSATADAVLLYLHGGAYVAGSPRTHLPIISGLARRFPGTVAALDYRLAPEHPFPAALEDALAAYQALLARDGGPSTIALAGDSAGGGLAAALLVEIDRRDLPRPAAVALFSPFADLSLSGDSLRALARREALLPTHRIAEVVDAYLGDADPRDPRASPVFARFAAPPPPCLIQVGASEALRDDAVRLADALRAAGGAVQLEVTAHAPHVAPFFAPVLPAARALLDRAALFLAHAVSSADRRPRSD